MEITVSARHTEVSDALRLAVDREDRPTVPLPRGHGPRRGPLLRGAQPAHRRPRGVRGRRSRVTGTTCGARWLHPTGSSRSTGRWRSSSTSCTSSRRSSSGATTAAGADGANGAVPSASVEASDAEGDRRTRSTAGPRIVKTKQHALKPMTPGGGGAPARARRPRLLLLHQRRDRSRRRALPPGRRRPRTHRRSRVARTRRRGLVRTMPIGWQRGPPSGGGLAYRLH